MVTAAGQKLRKRLQRIAQEQKDVLEKLADNKIAEKEAQQKVDLCRGKVPGQPPPAAASADDAATPELDPEELAFLGEQERKEYEAAKEAAKAAQQTLEAAKGATQARKEAAENLRKFADKAQECKRRRGNGGEPSVGGQAKPEQDSAAQSEPQKPYDFTDPADVDKFLEQTVRIRERTKTVVAARPQCS